MPSRASLSHDEHAEVRTVPRRRTRDADGARRPARGLDPARARAPPHARLGSARPSKPRPRAPSASTARSRRARRSQSRTSRATSSRRRAAQFSAVVTVTVSAPTQKTGRRAPEEARAIAQSHDDDGWILETRWPGMHGRGDRGNAPRRALRLPGRRRATSSTVPPGVDGGAADGQRRRARPGPRRRAHARVRQRRRSRSAGVHRSLEAQTVNGSIDAVARALSAERQSRAPDGQRLGHADAAEGRAVRALGRDDERHDRLDVPAAAAAADPWPATGRPAATRPRSPTERSRRRIVVTGRGRRRRAWWTSIGARRRSSPNR